VGFLLILAVPVMLAIIFFVFRLVARMSQKTLPNSDTTGVASSSFIGGMRWMTGNASSPLTRLSIYEWGVRFQGRKLVGPLIPRFELSFSEIKSAQLVRSTLLTTGVRILSTDTNMSVIFWTGEGIEILNCLSNYNVHIETVEKTIKTIEPFSG